jgi:hypothetical protein
MSSSPSFCGICDIRQISKPSEVWCPDCDEGFCTECLDHHIIAKSQPVNANSEPVYPNLKKGHHYGAIMDRIKMAYISNKQNASTITV